MVTTLPNPRKESISLGDQQKMMAIAALKSPRSKPDLKPQTPTKKTDLDIGQQQKIIGSNNTLVFQLTP